MISTGDAQLKPYITSYYKKLFGPSEVTLISLDESQIEGIPQVSDLENEFLTAPFTEEEVRVAIFQMEHNKAPGPDGFPPEFYQVFWGLVKDDLMAMFTDFYQRTFPLNRLNFGTIILLPKKSEARVIQQRSLLKWQQINCPPWPRD
jgi:hypothetical protein